MRVTLRSRKLVKPKTITPDHPSRYRISLVDQIQVPVSITVAFFYPAQGGYHAGDVEDKLSRLEESLSEALAIHYPLAGCYVPEGCFIDCNDEGVEFIVGQVDGRLEEILATNPDCPGHDLIKLITESPSQAELVSLIVVRVHLLECGALTICFSFLHKMADLSSAISFLKAWATLSRGGIVHEASRPSFDVASILPPNDWPSIQVSRSNICNSIPEKLVMNRFGFDRETFEKLESAIASMTNVDVVSTNIRSPSRVEIALGLVWKVLVKIDGWKSNGNLRPIAFTTPINLRGKTGLPTSKNEFGNLCINAYVEASIEDRGMELDGFVRTVQQTIRKARSKYASIDKAGELCDKIEEDSKNIVRIQQRNGKEAHVFSPTCWCGFRMYEIDFGFGKPELVMNPRPPFRKVILIDWGDGCVRDLG